jgi:hypothetical protein
VTGSYLQLLVFHFLPISRKYKIIKIITILEKQEIINMHIFLQLRRRSPEDKQRNARNM